MTESNILSGREREILALVAKGASNKEIARDLHISINTVKVHLRNIFTKIDANSRTEAAMYAVNAGIVEVESTASDKDQRIFSRISNRTLFIGIGVFALVSVLVIITILSFRGTAARNQAGAEQSPLSEEQRWQVKAPMSEARQGLAVAVYGGDIFAIAGETEQGVSGTVERYSPDLDQWEGMRSKPTPVADVSAAAIGGKIYVPGGRISSGEVTDILEIYSPIDDQWEQGADLPHGLSAYAMVSYEGYLYLFGGWDGKQVVNTSFQYDPDADQWQELTPMPTARSYPGVSVIEEKIFIIGGYDGEKALVANEIYTPALEGSDDPPWETGEPLPSPRYAMGVASLADTIYVVGGVDGEGESPGYIELSSEATEWKNFGEILPSGWSHLGATAVRTHLYLIGGVEDGVPINQNLAYQVIYLINLPVIR